MRAIWWIMLTRLKTMGPPRPIGAHQDQAYNTEINKNLFLYCIVSIHSYSASCSAHQSEALPVRETKREESSLERTKRHLAHQSNVLWLEAQSLGAMPRVNRAWKALAIDWICWNSIKSFTVPSLVGVRVGCSTLFYPSMPRVVILHM